MRYSYVVNYFVLTQHVTIVSTGAVRFDNLKKVSGVYCAIHRATGMCYVGSSVDIGARIGQHISDSKRRCRTCFHRALAKYGIGAFDFEVLQECSDNLLDKEEFFIRFLQSASLNGFNTMTSPTEGFRGRRHNAITRARIGIAHKGRRYGPEARANMSKAQRLSASSPANKARVSAQRSIQVFQIDAKTGIRLARFDSTTQASLATGISRTGINNAIKGRAKTSGGFQWAN